MLVHTVCLNLELVELYYAHCAGDSFSFLCNARGPLTVPSPDSVESLHHLDGLHTTLESLSGVLGIHLLDVSVEDLGELRTDIVGRGLVYNFSIPS